jgi:hypothetical protein
MPENPHQPPKECPLSNARIIDRLNGLADAIELGSLSVTELRDSLRGHINAIDGIPYDMVKEADYVWAQLSKAIDAGDEQNVDIHVLGDWLRNWTSRVPTN